MENNEDNRQMTVIAAEIKRIKDEQALNRYETISSEMDFAISVLESLLPKEEEQLNTVASFWWESGQSRIEVDFKQWFNETFKTSDHGK